MLTAMRHRGPDGQGCFGFPGGSAGMVRLALVDLSDRGQQPLWTADGTKAILFNGEIYNFREERARLEAKGRRFLTTTDTEVVLALYEELGQGFVERLRGMFVVAIFDWRRGKDRAPDVLLARDPLGIKTLYVRDAAGKKPMVFASELTTLMSSGLIELEVDRVSVAAFLRLGFVFQPRTLLAGVRVMRPGTLELHRPGEPVVVRQFWSVPRFEPRDETLPQAAERLRHVLEESVRLHAMADTPVGAFLSGGIDSTVVTGLMCRHVPHLRTFSMRFGAAGRVDEASQAAEMAARWGCEHTILDVSRETVAGAFSNYASRLDQPSIDGINTWLISEVAARHVKGVLSGLGGDEAFAGYRAARLLSYLETTTPGRLKRWLGKASHLGQGMVGRFGLGGGRLESLAQLRSPQAAWFGTHELFGPSATAALVGDPPVLAEFDQWVESELDTLFQGHDLGDPLQPCFLLDTFVYMTMQLLRDSDTTSMAHSLELRVPLADIEVVRFAQSCASRHKLLAGSRSAQYGESGAKAVLVEACKDLLPEGIASRPKIGFSLPIARWIGGEGGLGDVFADAVRASDLVSGGVLAGSGIASLNAAPAAYPASWGIGILEMWWRQARRTTAAARSLPGECDASSPLAQAAP
jgi:asparagine synthase (glutamine-hydrolysing)